MSVVLQFRTIRNSTVAINDHWLLLKPELLWLLVVLKPHTFYMNLLSVGARTPVTPGPVNPFSEIASSWKRSLESFFFYLTGLWTRMKRDDFEMRFQPARTEQGRSLPDNRGEPPGNSWWGVCRPVFQIRPKNVIFITRFQTWTLKFIPFCTPGKGRNMPSFLRLERHPWKRFLEIHF